MNCAEPANTIAENANAPNRDNPPLSARVPKMIPNGIAPTIKGKVSRIPEINSDCGVDFIKKMFVDGLFCFSEMF
jgi:hypothetical protein